jgi:hypothetical protein
MKFTVGYVGSKGTHLQRRINMNQAVPGTEPIQDRRPLPQLGDILLQTNSAYSNYSALQATILKQFTAGLSFWASYEWMLRMRARLRLIGAIWKRSTDIHST